MMYTFRENVVIGDLLKVNPKKGMFIEFLEKSDTAYVNSTQQLDNERFIYALNNTEGMIEFCKKENLLKQLIDVKDIQVVVENRRSKKQTRLGTLDDSFDIILENKNTPPGFSHIIFELSKQGIYRYTKPYIPGTEFFDSSLSNEFWSTDKLNERIRILN